ncbi:hypothetical protein MRX96_003538 [Rhipicephalus microplus]
MDAKNCGLASPVTSTERWPPAEIRVFTTMVGKTRPSSAPGCKWLWSRGDWLLVFPLSENPFAAAGFPFLSPFPLGSPYFHPPHFVLLPTLTFSSVVWLAGRVDSAISIL